jgi:hypothetical protein
MIPNNCIRCKSKALVVFLQINDLATATDKKRLEQFTEIAGSLTWKELQPKNDSLLKGKELK